ncbi:MAG TPA: L-seryl-tRNA(Sec) selenium transferase, partial [Candidatus Cloacimonas sp.]|nr:L-seryl-tRNA(Sec) selenium transferase [Candidatus Cloacimonas sp.]
KIPIFQMLNTTEEKLLDKAEHLAELLKERQIKYEIVDTLSQVGGGTLPALQLKSKAIKILPL